jgi:hypothetical protein
MSRRCLLGESKVQGGKARKYVKDPKVEYLSEDAVEYSAISEGVVLRTMLIGLELGKRQDRMGFGFGLGIFLKVPWMEFWGVMDRFLGGSRWIGGGLGTGTECLLGRWQAHGLDLTKLSYTVLELRMCGKDAA